MARLSFWYLFSSSIASCFRLSAAWRTSACRSCSASFSAESFSWNAIAINESQSLRERQRLRERGNVFSIWTSATVNWSGELTCCRRRSCAFLCDSAALRTFPRPLQATQTAVVVRRGCQDGSMGRGVRGIDRDGGSSRGETRRSRAAQEIKGTHTASASSKFADCVKLIIRDRDGPGIDRSRVIPPLFPLMLTRTALFRPSERASRSSELRKVELRSSPRVDGEPAVSCAHGLCCYL